MAEHTEKVLAEGAVTEYSKNVRHRVNRVMGHMARVKKMVDEGDDYLRVMIQLSAVRASLISTANELIRDEMNAALQEAHDTEDTTRLDQVMDSVNKYFAK